MSWPRIILLVLQMLSNFGSWLREREQKQAGAVEARAEDRKIQDDRIAKALAARRAAESGGLPDDDPYRRD